jgi:hypothetical protein
VARATRSVKARGVSVSARATPAASTKAATIAGSHFTIRTSPDSDEDKRGASARKSRSGGRSTNGGRMTRRGVSQHLGHGRACPGHLD